MQTLTTISVVALNWCRLHFEVRRRDIPAPGYADSGRREPTVRKRLPNCVAPNVCVRVRVESPFMVDVVDNRSLSVSGAGLTSTEVNQLTTFTVHTGQRAAASRNADDLQVIVRCTRTTISFHSLLGSITLGHLKHFLYDCVLDESKEFFANIYFYVYFFLIHTHSVRFALIWNK